MRKVPETNPWKGKKYASHGYGCPLSSLNVSRPVLPTDHVTKVSTHMYTASSSSSGECRLFLFLLYMVAGVHHSILKKLHYSNLNMLVLGRCYCRSISLIRIWIKPSMFLSRGPDPGLALIQILQNRHTAGGLSKVCPLS